MAAPQPRTGGDTLRLAADRLYQLAERHDTPSRSLEARQRLLDEIEAVAGDVRGVVRGHARQVNPPLAIERRTDGSWSGWW